MTPDAIAPKEGRWIAKPRKTRWFVYAGLIGMVLPQINLWFTLFSGGRGLGTEILVAIYAVLLLSALVYMAWAMRLNARDLRETEAMIDGGFGDQFPVDVAIVVEGRHIGSDRGVLWFADDRLGFSGRASSFVLASGDLAGGPRFVARGKCSRHIPQNALILRNAPKEAYVVVTPLKQGQRYRQRVRAFLPGNPHTEGERLLHYMNVDMETAADRQWPPMTPYEE